MTDQPTPAPSAPDQRRLREVLDACDVAGLRALIVEWPELATANLDQYPDHPRGVTALSYIAMLRFDAKRLGLADSQRDTRAMAQALLDAGARVGGLPGDRETPLMTAASYGDADVAEVLIRAGADLEAVAASDAGGVPGGTPLEHAAVFGMTDVVDLLVTSGARVASLEMAAAAGDLTGWALAEAPLEARVPSGWLSTTAARPASSGCSGWAPLRAARRDELARSMRSGGDDDRWPRRLQPQRAARLAMHG